MTFVNWNLAPQGAQYWFIHTGFFYTLLNNIPHYWDPTNEEWVVSTVNLEKLLTHGVKNPNIKTDPTYAAPTSSVDFLDKSKNLQEERGKQYDSPSGERSFDKVAAMFTAATGIALEGHHIALIQTHLKHVRAYSNTNKVHQDSLEDAVSYSALWAEEFKKTISKKE